MPNLSELLTLKFSHHPVWLSNLHWNGKKGLLMTENEKFRCFACMHCMTAHTTLPFLWGEPSPYDVIFMWRRKWKLIPSCTVCRDNGTDRIRRVMTWHKLRPSIVHSRRETCSRGGKVCTWEGISPNVCIEKSHGHMSWTTTVERYKNDFYYYVTSPMKLQCMLQLARWRCRRSELSKIHWLVESANGRFDCFSQVYSSLMWVGTC